MLATGITPSTTLPSHRGMDFIPFHGWTSASVCPASIPISSEEPHCLGHTLSRPPSPHLGEGHSLPSRVSVWLPPGHRLCRKGPRAQPIRGGRAQPQCSWWSPWGRDTLSVCLQGGRLKLVGPSCHHTKKAYKTIN